METLSGDADPPPPTASSRIEYAIITRLLVKYKHPPDNQPEAIKLVIEQMETLAPRYAEGAGR